MLLVEGHEMLRTQPLQAAPDLVGREPRLGHDLLLVQWLAAGHAQRDQDGALRTGEGNRLGPARSGVGWTGHDVRRGNTG